jgi:hypothetical protein
MDVALTLPRMVFGAGAIARMPEELAALGLRRQSFQRRGGLRT